MPMLTGVSEPKHSWERQSLRQWQTHTSRCVTEANPKLPKHLASIPVSHLRSCRASTDHWRTSALHFKQLGCTRVRSDPRDATDAPTNYESASDRFINPQEGDFTIGGFAPEYLPRAVVEQAGNLGGSLISRGAGATAAGVATGGNPLAVAGGAIAGPALFEFAQQLGPVAIERAKNNSRSEPTWDDWTAAASTAGVSGILNAIGVGGGKGASLLNKTLREGVTESAQSVTEQTGTTAGTDKGLTIDPKQAVGEGIIGGTTAGGFDVAGRTITAPGKLISDPKPEDQQAATGFANDLERVANDEGYNLKDVDTGSAIKVHVRQLITLHVEYQSDSTRMLLILKSV